MGTDIRGAGAPLVKRARNKMYIAVDDVAGGVLDVDSADPDMRSGGE